VGGKTKELFERNMPVKTAVVTKDELVEVGSDVFAAQPMCVFRSIVNTDSV